MYQLDLPEGVAYLVPTSPQSIEQLELLDTSSAVVSWNAPEVRLIDVEDGVTLRRSDTPWLADNAPTFSQRAVDLVGKHVSRYGELLPLRCDAGRFYVLNVLEERDALDWERSEVVRFSTGRVMGITQPKFKDDLLAGAEIFRVPFDDDGAVYLTETYRERLLAAGIEPQLKRVS